MHTRVKASACALALAAFTLSPAAQAAVDLIAIGSLGGSSDLSGLTGLLENGVDHGNVLGGLGSGLAWAGGTSFLSVPDRGPNAASWNAALDNTTSYLSRFQTLDLKLSPAAGGSSLPFTLTPTLNATTLLYSTTALSYGAVTPANNAAGRFFFSGRSDNFSGSGSTNPNNARFDPEAIRVSNDGRSVFISDEYGPYVYRFDRATGARTATYTLPSNFSVANLSPVGNNEITGNSSGRVANKGMEGLAITPDGSKLVGFEQSPLIQDGGDGGRANRIVTIDVNSGATHQYVYDNFLGDTNKTYNSSEILALNSHEFLVLERDGKGMGDGSNAVVKRIYKIDLDGATDVSGQSGESALLGQAVNKTLFLDLKANLGSHGISASNVPAKLEGMAFGEDVMIGGTLHHTLYVANDNDFLSAAGSNNFYVFAFTDADLGGSVFQNQGISAAVPEPATWAFMLSGLAGLGFIARRRRAA